MENLAAAGVVSRTGASAWDVSTVTQYAVQAGNSGQKIASLPLGTSGQVLTSNGAGANPSWQTTAASFIWTEVTGTSVAMAVNNGYILNNAGLVTATLPDTATVGSIVRIVGKGAGGWRIAQNAGEQIHFFLDTTGGISGRLDSTNRYDCIDLICTVVNSDWTVMTSMGNITVT